MRKRAEMGGRSFDSREMFIGPWPLRTDAMFRLACQTDLGEIWSIPTTVSYATDHEPRREGTRCGTWRWGPSLLAWPQLRGPRITPYTANPNYTFSRWQVFSFGFLLGSLLGIYSNLLICNLKKSITELSLMAMLQNSCTMVTEALFDFQRISTSRPQNNQFLFQESRKEV